MDNDVFISSYPENYSTFHFKFEWIQAAEFKLQFFVTAKLYEAVLLLPFQG